MPTRADIPPLFERLIYYILAPDLFARIVLETGLNMYPPSLTQPKQWVFYLILAIEYIFQGFGITRYRFRRNFTNGVVLLLGVMATHGVIAGLSWGNPLPKMFTDTIPVITTAINVLLLNRDEAFRGFDFDRLAKAVISYSALMVVVGAVAVSAGRNSVVSLGGAESTPICLSIVIVYLNRKRIVTAVDLLWTTAIIGPTVPTLNRTTLLVFSIAFLLLVIPHIMRDWKQTYFASLFFGVVAVSFILFIPADSMVMKRINASIDHINADKDEDAGSLYERKAEWAAINLKLAALGPAARYFGYGAGGTYFVIFSNGIVPENYSHAHFSWSLFYLRYGDAGFVYLGLYGLLLLATMIQGALRPDPLSRTILVIGMWCVVFLFTYTMFNFLAAGVQFADGGDAKRAKA